MGGIFGDIDVENEVVKKFREKSKGLPKEKVREMEKSLLKAEKIKTYLGSKAKTDELSRKTLSIYFPDESNISVVSSIMSINTYLGYNSYDVERLISFANQVKNGEIKYDDKAKKFFCSEKKRRIRHKKIKE